MTAEKNPRNKLTVEEEDYLQLRLDLNRKSLRNWKKTIEKRRKVKCWNASFKWIGRFVEILLYVLSVSNNWEFKANTYKRL